MKTVVLSMGAALLALLPATTEAASFPRAVSGNGYLKVPVGTVDRPRKTKRDGGTVETVLENKEFFYAMDREFFPFHSPVEVGRGGGRRRERRCGACFIPNTFVRIAVDIGTPGQTITVLVDTGSSELWINPNCSTAPSESQARECRTFGQYDPDKSTTPPVGPFGSEQLNYGDSTDPKTQTSVSIQYYRDTLSIGDASITNQTFGVAVSSNGQSQGIFGLAPDLNSGFDSDLPYSLVLSTMAAQGVIASRVFTLDLRHAVDQEGAVTYGGIDRSKFIGSLQRTPIIKGLGGESRLAVRLNTLGMTLGADDADGSTPLSYELEGTDGNVLLDSGTTLTRLRFAVARPILSMLRAVEDGQGYYYVPCSTREAAGSVDFGFNGKTVRVPLSDFILDLGQPDVCAVGIAVTTGQQILGDTVLRAGFFVFDWDNEEVHVAQAANCGDADIVAVGSGTDAVPSVTGNCKEDDGLFAGGPVVSAIRKIMIVARNQQEKLTLDSLQTTATTASSTQATSSVTTTFTVSSCDPSNAACQTGVLTTQTLDAAAATATVTATSDSDSNNENDGESLGVGRTVPNLTAFGIGILAICMYNVMN
ncbi:Eukaryotic aspartyl protease [Geosmithia morbida]|uniref:Eukaryotic aspartyl protease n=1 Tax=Geosmithia morbida TaxID=1094350 RepID=A0A9P5D692_9HYPO|nr:Eukaryotic aspartyl protease [Geosmithia morbida]KAF4124535.1 Eukaryotic aspartyl protease [Geosmithia morbida]